MKSQPTVQKLVHAICQANADLDALVPLNPQMLNSQRRRIVELQKELRVLEDDLTNFIFFNYRSTIHKEGRFLLRMVDELAIMADEIQLLLEEYLVDPDGVMACSMQLVQRRQDWPAKEQRLQQMLQRSRPAETPQIA